MKKRRGRTQRLLPATFSALAFAVGVIAGAVDASAGGKHDVQAPRADEVQAPRGNELQAPRGNDVQAPHRPDVTPL